ncbi:MAG: HAD-IC family P-type ATPase [Gammaproteobacteria bacterium]|nr:HAD-IC family P-type ATPase [Gammaproteobacteria bacterium]
MQSEQASLVNSEKIPWHALSEAVVLQRCGVDPEAGLDGTEVEQRQVEAGFNRLESQSGGGWSRLLLRQLSSVLIFILLFAAGVSWLVGERVDAIAILMIVLLNAALGFVQEWRAERSIEALQRLLVSAATVLRGGVVQRVDRASLVPGDIVLLAPGDQAPADIRLTAGVALEMDESALTGESVTVPKEVTAVAEETPLYGRASMLHMGTAVAAGRGRGVVVATGMRTQLGRIAGLAQGVDRAPTPLQRRLSRLARQLGFLSLSLALAVSLLGWLGGRPLFEMFLVGVSLAVAVVPEGLPAVVTITLALGVQSMARRNALLRRLPTTETLGATDVICTDKTGTLTRGEMTVRRIWLPSGELEVTGVGYGPEGQFLDNDRVVAPATRPELLGLLRTARICNHATVAPSDDGWVATGDPTEAALIALWGKAGAAETVPQLLGEFPFDSRRKRMTVVAGPATGPVAHVKGAPEIILPRCRFVQTTGGLATPMTAALSAQIEARYEAYADSGLRTLAIACRELPDQRLEVDEVEADLTLLGLVGIIDSARPEVGAAIATAATAGIRTIVITGDAGRTAVAVANEVGLNVEQVVTGAELSEMSDAELDRCVGGSVLFARTAPEQKLRIVQMLQRQNHVVGMTGDGINDAPALKQADIGIAMGIRGTDVARASADMVLTDDNFVSIVAAVEEGRRQFANISKFVRYLLSSNIGEVVAILLNILLGGPLILVPAQLLWVNLVTDGLTAVALGLEPVEPGVMQRPPRSASEGILGRHGLLTVLILGGYVGLVPLVLFHYYLTAGADLELARTVAFTSLVMAELFNLFNFRALYTQIWGVPFFSNPWLLGACGLSLVLQLLVIYWPPLGGALKTVPLSMGDWFVITLCSAPILLLGALWKQLQQRGPGRRLNS